MRDELDLRAEAAVALAPLLGPILPANGVDRFGDCTCGNPRCERAGKHPARRNYKGMATTDPDTLRSYWRLVPFNLALLIPAHITVIDADAATALALMARYRPWPFTPTAITSRGVHGIFLWPLEGDSPTVGGLDRVPLDVRGAGELCTLPPSVGASGHRYRWRDGESPHDIPIASLPMTFAFHVRAVARKRRDRLKPAVDCTTLEGALWLARRRATFAAGTSNGAGRGASGLHRTLTEAGAAPAVIRAALDTFTAEAGR